MATLIGRLAARRTDLSHAGASIQNWADAAPPPAGPLSFTDAQASNVLEKGMGPEGEALRPPMHTYQKTHDDAQAIIAYLRSLPAEKH